MFNSRYLVCASPTVLCQFFETLQIFCHGLKMGIYILDIILKLFLSFLLQIDFSRFLCLNYYQSDQIRYWEPCMRNSSYHCILETFHALSSWDQFLYIPQIKFCH